MNIKKLSIFSCFALTTLGLILGIYLYKKKNKNTFFIFPFTRKKIKKCKNKGFGVKNFKKLKKASKKLCSTNEVDHTLVNKKLGKTFLNNVFLTKQEFNCTLQRFISSTQKSPFGKPKHWVNMQNPGDSFFGIDKEKQKYKFFVQKIIVNPETEIAIHSDIHGDLQGLIKYLKCLVSQGKINKKFKIIDKNFYLVFLGDYVGGWMYGTEVLYTLLRLKIKNPDNVILIRGNHEDIFKNKISDGFAKEFTRAKFNLSKEESNRCFNRLGVIYNLLPSALFLGVKNDDEPINYALFTHGGIEPRFNPHDLLSNKRAITYQWINKLDISWFKDFNCNIYDKPIYNTSNPKHIGFIWNDFIVGDDQKPLDATRNIKHVGLYRFGKPVVDRFLKACGIDGKYYVKAIFSGHQHSDKAMAKKFLKHNDIYCSWAKVQWDGKSPIRFNTNELMVWTLNASPWWKKNDIFAQHPDFCDIHAILKVDKKFENWILTPKRICFDPAKRKKKKYSF